MNARFCIKNGQVDWSASPNVETFEPSGEKPFDGKILTQGALRQIVHLHFMSMVSNKTRGQPANLRGAILNHDARQLVAVKLGENGAATWAEVIATMGL